MRPPSRPSAASRTASASARPDTRLPQPGAEHPPERRRTPSALAVLGRVLLCSGLVCLGWVTYQLVGTDIVAAQDYQREAGSLRARWNDSLPALEPTPGPAAGPATLPARQRANGAGTRQTTGPGTPTRPGAPGEATALLRIPRLGSDYEVPILEGTGLGVLARGVGHYAGTAEPGQVGNFALAGHRITHGQPFSRLLDLDVGDQVVIETRDATYTYVLDTSPRDLTVKETAGWVLDPDPGQAGTVPDTARITLTTCQDLFRSPDRSVGFGHLERTQPR